MGWEGEDTVYTTVLKGKPNPSTIAKYNAELGKIKADILSLGKKKEALIAALEQNKAEAADDITAAKAEKIKAISEMNKIKAELKKKEQVKEEMEAELNQAQADADTRLVDLRKREASLKKLDQSLQNKATGIREAEAKAKATQIAIQKELKELAVARARDEETLDELDERRALVRDMEATLTESANAINEREDLLKADRLLVEQQISIYERKDKALKKQEAEVNMKNVQAEKLIANSKTTLEKGKELMEQMKDKERMLASKQQALNLQAKDLREYSKTLDARERALKNG